MFLCGNRVACACDIAPEDIKATKVPGVDLGILNLGILNLAIDSGGTHHPGETVEAAAGTAAGRTQTSRHQGRQTQAL